MKRTCAIVALLCAGSAQAAYHYDVEGTITAVHNGEPGAVLPIRVGDAYTGVITYSPETAAPFPYGHLGAIAYEIRIGTHHIYSLQPQWIELGPTGGVWDLMPTTTLNPEGFYPDDFMWSLGLPSPLPSAADMLAGILNSHDWWLGWAENMSVDGTVTSATLRPSQSVPEPSSLALLGLGLLGFARTFTTSLRR